MRVAWLGTLLFARLSFALSTFLLSSSLLPFKLALALWLLLQRLAGRSCLRLVLLRAIARIRSLAFYGRELVRTLVDWSTMALILLRDRRLDICKGKFRCEICALHKHLRD